MRRTKSKKGEFVITVNPNTPKLRAKSKYMQQSASTNSGNGLHRVSSDMPVKKINSSKRKTPTNIDELLNNELSSNTQSLMDEIDRFSRSQKNNKGKLGTIILNSNASAHIFDNTSMTRQTSLDKELGGILTPIRTKNKQSGFSKYIEGKVPSINQIQSQFASQLLGAPSKSYAPQSYSQKEIPNKKNEDSGSDTSNSNTPAHSRFGKNSKRVISIKTGGKKGMQFKHHASSKKGFNPMYDKPNQDSYLIREIEIAGDNSQFYAVADGHGPNGHDVSKFILETLFSLLESALVSIPIDKMVDSLISSAITSCYIESNEKLKASEIEHNYSGSTLVCAIIYKNTLYLSNVGDSRGIVVSKNKSRLITSLETIDHNPSIPSERQRIEASGGKVSPALDSNKQPFGPDRVWNQAMTEPGLAMTRSMGDFTAESLGITSKPDIHIKKLNYNDKFIMLASDGVWEALTNDGIISKVMPLYCSLKLKSATNVVVKDSALYWDKVINKC